MLPGAEELGAARGCYLETEDTERFQFLVFRKNLVVTNTYGAGQINGFINSGLLQVFFLLVVSTNI